MEIIISDTYLVERIYQLADRLKWTPEQVIEQAIGQRWPETRGTDDGFWESLIGLGASGDPDLAFRKKDILHEEVDPP